MKTFPGVSWSDKHFGFACLIEYASEVACLELNLSRVATIWKKFITKFLEKLETPWFLAIFGPFCQFLGCNGFSWKIGLSVFKFYNYLPPCQKRAIVQRDKLVTDRQRDGPTIVIS